MDSAGFSKEEVALVSAARPAISGFATVAAFMGPKTRDAMSSIILAEKEFALMDKSLEAMLFFAAVSRGLGAAGRCGASIMKARAHPIIARKTDLCTIDTAELPARG